MNELSRAARRWTVLPLVCLFSGTALAGDSTGADGGVAMTHRMMMLVLQLGVILFAAKLGSILFEKIKLPGTLGELVAGIAIGPFAMGRIGFYGFPHGMFPMPPAGGIAVSPELYGLAAVAAVVLLFNIGLETDLKLLLRYALVGGLVGLGGLLVSFFLGAASVMVFSRLLFGRELSLLAPQCLLLGTIATATSVGISARILSEKRKLDSPEGVTILSAAVIDDVLGIILLAIVMSVVAASKSRAAGGVDWGHVAVVGLRAVGVWLAASAIGLIASRRISFLLKWFGERTSIAVMALGLALILAGLFEEAGLAMIIGAYVMGLSLSRADINHVIREKLAPICALLVPVFFCVMGMQIDLGALGELPVLAFGLVYAAVALLSKVVGCGLPALLANFNLRGAARIGFGMAPRCEVALVIAGVGVSAGLLGPQIVAAVVIMVVVNTIVAPPVLVFLFRGSQRGTRKEVLGQRDGTEVSFEFPSVEMTEFFLRKLQGVFESEGYFIHQLRREPPLHELRKDKTVIGLRQTGSTLIFTCRRPDVPLANTAMYEALAAVEQAVRGLKKPLDAQAIRTRVQDAGPLGPATLNMADYLTPDLIEPRLRATDKLGVIDELLEVLARNGLVTDIDAARQAVRRREESMSTGLQYGVAIPHGRTDTVNRLVCAVGIKPDGLDFDAIDGQPSRIFILTLSPESKPAPHVQFMSTVSQVLNADGRDRILAGRGAREIHRAFTAPLPPATPATRRRKPEALPTEFRLGDYLKPALVTPRLRGRTVEKIIDELLDLLDRDGALLDRPRAAAAVLGREAQMPTGMSEGLAVPHGRTDAVERLVCAVGVAPDGVKAGAPDGRPARIFVLVLTPESGAGPYLQFVAAVMTALDAQGRRRALAARTPKDLFDALTQPPRRAEQ